MSDACPSTPPVFSNVNVNAGTNLPNRVMLRPNQDICVYNLQGSINYIVDVNGWFGTGAETSPGLSLPPPRPPGSATPSPPPPPPPPPTGH